MASVTQLGLLLDEQEFFVLGVMGRVAIEASYVAVGVGGLGKMGLRMGLAVAGQAAGARFLPRLPLEHEYFRFVAAASYVVSAGAMATFTALL